MRSLLFLLTGILLTSFDMADGVDNVPRPRVDHKIRKLWYFDQDDLFLQLTTIGKKVLYILLNEFVSQPISPTQSQGKVVRRLIQSCVRFVLLLVLII